MYERYESFICLTTSLSQIIYLKDFDLDFYIRLESLNVLERESVILE